MKMLSLVFQKGINQCIKIYITFLCVYVYIYIMYICYIQPPRPDPQKINKIKLTDMHFILFCRLYINIHNNIYKTRIHNLNISSHVSPFLLLLGFLPNSLCNKVRALMNLLGRCFGPLFQSALDLPIIVLGSRVSRICLTNATRSSSTRTWNATDVSTYLQL